MSSRVEDLKRKVASTGTEFPSTEHGGTPVGHASDARKSVVRLAARIELFDSFWQTPKDLEKGYKSFYQYYEHNYLPHLPGDVMHDLLA